MGRTVRPKVRYQVLQRDKFTCQYCGSKPPEAILEIDHVNPVSNGGSDDPENLKTSCRACNSGKSNGLPEIDFESPEIKKAIELAYSRGRKRGCREVETEIWNRVRTVFSMHWTGFSDVGIHDYFPQFVTDEHISWYYLIGIHDVFEMANAACILAEEPHESWKIFEAHCRRLTVEREEEEE